MSAPLKYVVAALTAGCLITLLGQDCDAEGLEAGNLTVGNNADGRLEVFHIDRFGELRHRWQREASHDWSSWSGLGGNFCASATAANDKTGRLIVFAVDRDSRVVKYKSQTEPNSHTWSDWVALPGQRVEEPVAVCADGNGRLEVFAVSANRHVAERIWQIDDAGNWSHWAEMGAVLDPNLQVIRDHLGRLEVFGIQMPENRLLHCRQTRPDEPGNWSPWVALGGSVMAGFAVGQNGDGRLEIFGVKPEDGEVVHSFQLSADSDPTWSSWFGFGAKMKPAITLGRNSDGRLELFAVNPKNNLIYGAYQNKANTRTNWTGWKEMSQMGGLYTLNRRSNITAVKATATDTEPMANSTPAIAENKSGGLELFAFDARETNVLMHRSQIGGDLHWTDWFRLDRASTQYGLRAWRSDDGLPDNRVQAIAQSPDGCMWVGTHNGLARFDGVQFTRSELPDALPGKNASVTSLLAEEDGALWVGMDGGGLVRLSKEDVQRYGSGDGLAGNRVITLYEDRGKSLWIGTTEGLSHYEQGKFVNYTNKDEIGPVAVESVVEDSASNVWVATDNKLICIQGKKFARFATARDLGHFVKCLWLDAGGRLWIGSDRGLVLHRFPNNFFPYDRRFGLSDRIVHVIHGDTQGNLWVGTDSGLTRFEEGRFVEDVENEGVSFGQVNALFEDREGDLWVGSQNGLFRLTPKKLLSFDQRQGLSKSHVTAVMEGDAETLWVGTSGGGLNELKDGSFAAYAPTTNSGIEWVTALCQGRNGIWIGGDYNSGLGQVRGGRFVGYTSQNGLPHGRINVIHEDRSNRLWVGSGAGLSCLRDGEFKTYTVRDNLAGDVVRAICEDREGNLWIGTDGGVSLRRGGEFINYTTRNGLSDNVVTALYADGDDSLWIGTENGGLNRIRKGRITAYSVEKGLFSDEILSIVEDDFGWLWMSCSKGVFRVSKSSLDDIDAERKRSTASIAYGYDDGMNSVLCSAGNPGSCKGRDGRLWFPTSLGLVVMDPRAMTVNRKPPPVYIEQMMVDGSPCLPKNNGFLTATPAGPVRLPPGRHELEFHYTALSFQRPERIRFRYWLEGAEPDWVDAGTRRVAYYNNLPAGRYSFHVIACNSDGVWNDTGARLVIVLPPHFWQTWWFVALCGAATVAAFGSVVRYITKRKMEKRLQQIQQRHAVELERTRIARDMHDELGAKLTRISFQGAMARKRLQDAPEAARHVDKMALTARELVRSLDEIVWAVDPKNDSLEDMATYICRYASAFFEGTPVYCVFRIPDRLPECRLTSDVRHHLFQASKEAFNNILKHSRATAAEVELRCLENTFEIRIADNGQGFSESGLAGSDRVGHGLVNLKERLASIHGHCEISATPGEGTVIHIVVPLNSPVAV